MNKHQNGCTIIEPSDGLRFIDDETLRQGGTA